MANEPTFPLLPSTTIPAAEAPVEPQTVYLVLAIWLDGSRWSQPSAAGLMYLSLEKAQAVAAKLAAGWHHRRIVEVRLS